MFSLDHFPKSSPVWHFSTIIGSFWILPTPSHKYLWGVEDRTLGLSITIPLILDFIRRQKTSYVDWDRLSPCPPLPGLSEWVMSHGNGAFNYRYIQPDLGRNASRPSIQQADSRPGIQDVTQDYA